MNRLETLKLIWSDPLLPMDPHDIEIFKRAISSPKQDLTKEEKISWIGRKISGLQPSFLQVCKNRFSVCCLQIYLTLRLFIYNGVHHVTVIKERYRDFLANACVVYVCRQEVKKTYPTILEKLEKHHLQIEKLELINTLKEENRKNILSEIELLGGFIEGKGKEIEGIKKQLTILKDEKALLGELLKSRGQLFESDRLSEHSLETDERESKESEKEEKVPLSSKDRSFMMHLQPDKIRENLKKTRKKLENKIINRNKKTNEPSSARTMSSGNSSLDDDPETLHELSNSVQFKELTSDDITSKLKAIDENEREYNELIEKMKLEIIASEEKKKALEADENHICSEIKANENSIAGFQQKKKFLKAYLDQAILDLTVKDREKCTETHKNADERTRKYIGSTFFRNSIIPPKESVQSPVRPIESYSSNDLNSTPVEDQIAAETNIFIEAEMRLQQMNTFLKDLNEKIGPDFGSIWEGLFTNIETQMKDHHCLKEWSLDENGSFTLSLNSCYQLGMITKDDKGNPHPPGGTVLIFNENIVGRIDNKDKKMVFESGLELKCKPKVLFAIINFHGNVFSLNYLKEGKVGFVAGNAVKQEITKTSIEKLKLEWSTGQLVTDAFKFVDDNLKKK